MMKHAFLFLTVLFAVVTAAHSQQASHFTLNQTGKPDYRKQVKADNGIAVYKRGNVSVATILPREYFVLGDFNDTIELAIKKNKKAGEAPYLAECTNCTNISFLQWSADGVSYYTLSSGEDFVQFMISYEKEKSGIIVPPPLEPADKPDTEIGYIRMQNMLTHYAAVPSEPDVNLAIVDMNHNGRADNADFVSLSHDAFFYSASRDRSQPMSRVKTIAINGHLYDFKLNDGKQFAVSLTPSDAKTAPDLLFQDMLTDLEVGDKRLYRVIDSAKTVVLFHWTEFSRPSMLTIPALNELSETVTVIGLHTGGQDLPYLTERYSMDFYNTHCTDEHKNKLNLGDYPHYLIIDDSKTVVLQTKDIEEVVKYFSGGQ